MNAAGEDNNIYFQAPISVSLGTFYYTCQAAGKGVDAPEKVNANQITAVRVQFLPAHQKEGTQITRALVGNLSFTEYVGKETSQGGGNNGEDENEHPLG